MFLQFCHSNRDCFLINNNFYLESIYNKNLEANQQYMLVQMVSFLPFVVERQDIVEF